MIKRRKTRKIKVGNIFIGGNAPVVVQSMCNTDTRDVKATVKQIKKLQEAGCEMIRVAVLDLAAAKANFDRLQSATARDMLGQYHSRRAAAK